MVRCGVIVALLWCCVAACGQDATNPRRQWSVFAEYANTSSRMMIGEARERKLVGIGGSHSWLVGTHPKFAYRWQVDVRPLVLIGSPYDRVTTVYRVNGQKDQVATAEGNTLNACVPGTVTGDLYFGGVKQGTYTSTSVCSRQWTYAGAVSPLGQRFNFFPKQKVQPYFAANAGFLAATREVPLQRTAKFNFTFEFGAGLEWFVRPGKSWALDWRYHHISNAGRGQQNAGIDSGIFKVRLLVWALMWLS